MATDVEIRAPAEQTEGTRSQILRWLKSVGDRVTENEPLIEIETDKVTVEVASPGSGTLQEIVKQEQEEIAPGELLGRIGTAGAGDGAKGSSTAVAGKGVGGGSAAGAGKGVAVGAARVAGARAHASDGAPSDAEAAEHATMAPRLPASLSDAGSNAGGSGGDGLARHSAPIAGGDAAQTLSPAVRRLLAERGLDAANVRGTGQGGRITVEDVLGHRVDAAADGAGVIGSGAAAAAITGASAVAGRAAAGVNNAVTPDHSAAAGPSRRIPHTATRKRIAEHMVQSLLHTAPHVTAIFEADLTAVLEHRRRNKEDFAKRGVPLTLTAYFLQASVAAIRSVPEVNSRWTDTAIEIFDSMHIGVATALDTGLIVPVLRDVQSRDLFEIAQGLEDLVSRAREGRLSPADMRGGTFTISNHGVSGSLVATPIVINQPQAAILGVGKLEKRPIVSEEGDAGDRIVIRPRCYVTLTIDHRVMDGHQANRFLQTFVGWLATSPT